MLTDNDITNLIALRKTIVKKTPSRGYRREYGHKRCDLMLNAATDDTIKFLVFIRQHEKFIENFSIGLRYQIRDGNLRTITLTRYNSAHGETSRDPDGHYGRPHIHRVNALEITSGTTNPQERHREVTTRYHTYGAFAVFFSDARLEDYADYFPELGQRRLFNGN